MLVVHGALRHCLTNSNRCSWMLFNCILIWSGFSYDFVILFNYSQKEIRKKGINGYILRKPFSCVRFCCWLRVCCVCGVVCPSSPFTFFVYFSLSFRFCVVCSHHQLKHIFHLSFLSNNNHLFFLQFFINVTFLLCLSTSIIIMLISRHGTLADKEIVLGFRALLKLKTKRNIKPVDIIKYFVLF